MESVDIYNEPIITSQIGISETFNLSPSDIENRSKSFVNEKALRLAGIRRVSDDVGHQILGISTRKKGTDYNGLAIPCFDIWNSNNLIEWEIRRDKPDSDEGGDGKLKEKRKYIKPFSTKNQLYVSPLIKPEWLKDKKKKIIVITEGAFKALAYLRAASNDFTSDVLSFIPLAISGVDNFKTKQARITKDGEKITVSAGLPEFDNIEWKNAIVIFSFDSDIDEKPNVKFALSRAKKFFRQKNVKKVFHLDFPKEFEGIPTKGIDDFLGAIESKYDTETAIAAALELVDEAQKPKKAQTPLADNFKLIENGEGEKPGVYYTDENGESFRICAPLKIVSKTDDGSGSKRGLILEWLDDQNRRHRWAMPIGLVHSEGSELAKYLHSNGLEVMPSRKHREKLAFYLATSKPEKLTISTDKIGWHNECFVLPDQTFGSCENGIVYQTEYEGHHNFKTAGTLEEWQKNISEFCPKNSRLLFAASVPFAAPLLWVTKTQGGGFHLRGSTSTGKTTASLIAGSVCGGDPEHGFVQTWKSTANGLEITAAGHNHSLLVLDEIGECEPRELGKVAYMLANGKGKGRMTRTLQSQKPITWSLLFLSTGEQSLADIVEENGGKIHGGQDIRLCDISADTGKFGLFEDLHSFSSGQAFSDHLRAAACRYYGTPIREFLTWLTESDLSEIQERWHEVKTAFISDVLPEKEKFPEEVFRVAARFALVALGGELATEADITKWKPGEAYEAAKTVFYQWMRGRAGNGKSDIERGIAQVRKYIQNYEPSRFQKLWATDEDKIFERVGFIRKNNEDEREFLIFPADFKSICKGFDYTAIAAAMKQRGLLLTDGTNATKPEKINVKFSDKPGKTQRFYVVTERIFNFDEDAEMKSANA